MATKKSHLLTNLSCSNNSRYLLTDFTNVVWKIFSAAVAVYGWWLARISNVKCEVFSKLSVVWSVEWELVCRVVRVGAK